MKPRLSDKQKEVVTNLHGRWNLRAGAVRSGKTYETYFSLGWRMRSLPSGSCLLVGKTERTLARNVLDPMRDIWGSDMVSQVHGDGTVELFGRRCYVCGANDEKAVTKIQGMTLVYAYGDEFTTWPETFFQMLRSRLSQPGACFDGTCNPEGPYHWAKLNLFDKADGVSVRAWHFVLDDNPFLDPQFVAALKSEYTGLWYKRYIQGLWVAAEGAVYDMFDESLHVVDDLPIVKRWWTGIDYGTANPTVFLLFGLGADDCLYAVDEWRWDSTQQGGRQKTDGEYSKELRAFLGRWKQIPTWQFVDPSATSFITQLYHDKIPNIAYADNTVLDGIRRVGSLMAAGKLRFHRRCKGLIQEISGYVWDAKKQKQGEDEPMKQADHGPDATRYFVNGTRDVWQDWVRIREAA